MTEKNHENNVGTTEESRSPNQRLDIERDAAAKSLSEALGVSFIILKVIMVVLVIVFLASGFRTVGSDEQALVLRFGKIRGIGESRLLGPGLHWTFPYPIDEIVKIPVAKKPNLPINSFWYFQTKKEMVGEDIKDATRVEPVLRPIIDGYCLTRGEKQTGNISGTGDSDYNIVHCKWQLAYQIDDPERFFKNVYVEDVKPGQIYFDVMTESITPLLENLVSDAVVAAMVNYTIDQAILSQDRIPKHVKKLLQEKLDKIDSGITVVSIQLTDITWPRQVDQAFLASIRASQASQRTISMARGYAEKTINETAGPVAGQLLASLRDETISDEEKELLWSQLAGNAQEEIANARAYRTKVVETAKANAEYLQKLLPEYRKRPKLIIQKLYQDAVEFVLDNADEKMIIQPTHETKGNEIRILLNRDPAIKPKSQKEQ